MADRNVKAACKGNTRLFKPLCISRIGLRLFHRVAQELIPFLQEAPNEPGSFAINAGHKKTENCSAN